MQPHHARSRAESVPPRAPAAARISASPHTPVLLPPPRLRRGWPSPRGRGRRSATASPLSILPSKRPSLLQPERLAESSHKLCKPGLPAVAADEIMSAGRTVQRCGSDRGAIVTVTVGRTGRLEHGQGTRAGSRQVEHGGAAALNGRPDGLRDHRAHHAAGVARPDCLNGSLGFNPPPSRSPGRSRIRCIP